MSCDSDLLTDQDWKHFEHTVLVRHRLEEQYGNLDHQNETASLGMWLFLATEVMFFGTLFTALFAYRHLYAEVFELASSRLNWQIGSINTVVLLVSSLFMALGVHFVRANQNKPLLRCLLATALLGCCFLGLKSYEYYDDYHRGLVLGRHFHEAPFLAAGLAPSQLPQVKLFLLLYWVMTAAHALHMVIGVAAVLVIAALARNRHFDADYYGPVEVVGLYWHFVDVVWIFLLPSLYLLGTHLR